MSAEKLPNSTGISEQFAAKHLSPEAQKALENFLAGKEAKKMLENIKNAAEEPGTKALMSLFKGINILKELMSASPLSRDNMVKAEKVLITANENFLAVIRETKLISQETEQRIDNYLSAVEVFLNESRKELKIGKINRDH